jgi:hypothetical protein
MIIALFETATIRFGAAIKITFNPIFQNPLKYQADFKKCFWHSDCIILRLKEKIITQL